jgi:ketosteroid isomerase-like protein
MRQLAIGAVLCLLASALCAQLYDTEVWVGTLDTSGGGFKISDLKNISNHPGYDNQPAFFSDGTRLVFTAESADVEDTGHSVHPIIYDLTSGTSMSIPDALGFSPTPATPKTLMLLRDGRVYLHDIATGREIGMLTNTKDAGYFSRFDDRTYVLFMNDKERRIVIYDAQTKALETMARGAITPLYRVPGARAVTFVAEEPFPVPETNAPARKLVLHRFDVDQKLMTTLATIPFVTGGHHVWTSHGTILIASGKTIYEWSPANPDEWKPVYVSDHPDLQGITRIALSPRGDRIALVSTPRAETVIRDSRAASNRALAAHNGAAFAQLLAKDTVVTGWSGTTWTGREAVQKAVEEKWTATADLVYVRTPQTVDVSHDGNVASERGTWTSHGTAPGGVAEWRGNYDAEWRSTIGDGGYPSWTIAAEHFIALDCAGPGCPAPPK